MVTALLSALTRAPCDEEYRLGPKDVLTITVLGHSDLSTQEGQEITVRPDGRISYPGAGEIEVAGKTPAQVQRIIRMALERTYRHVDVAVNLARPRERRIYILGEVNSPGAFDLAHEDVGVREAIAMAGGLTPHAAMNGCRLYGRDVGPMRIDLTTIMADEANPGQPRLAPGDTLVILRKKTVTVVGEVKAPGVYQMQDGARVLDALAAAGGLTQRSDRNVAKLVRAESANATINLKAAFSEPASDANAILHSGDTLIIQEAYNQVAVLGAVERPGTFYSPERLTAAQALALAGGPTDDADLEHVKRLRAGEQPRVVDLRPLVQTTRTSSLDQFSAGADAVVLERGDALIVPARFQRVMVLGAVRAPGAYPIQPGDRVTDALAAAGGHIVGKSRIERIALMRRDADRVIVHRIDLRRLVAGRDQSQDQLVSDGDIIVVPGAAKTRWRDYAWLVFGAASAARYAVEVFK